MKQIIYVFLLTVLSSCDSYLSKVPSPSTSAPINNVEQLVAIYDNATAFINETNPFACYSNDDADLTAELYKADPSAFAISSTVFYNILHTAGIASQDGTLGNQGFGFGGEDVGIPSARNHSNN